MFKVVIIDDEAIIVQGLKKIVPWEKYNCEVVATAFDGISGGEIIRENKPDIVFTDIQMPNIDGLVMLAGLKSEFPDMQIAVLTGFSDFAYAQQAIKLGVSRYLLKPSKMGELEEALQAMTTVLQKNSAPEVIIEESTDAGSFIVKQAVAFIEGHYSEKLSLCDVANECFVSQWHLSKLLNKHTNQSFYDIFNGVRIKQAKLLLADPSLKLVDICELVGYADTAHFSRVFKKIAGVSANEYRNKFIIPHSHTTD